MIIVTYWNKIDINSTWILLILHSISWVWLDYAVLLYVAEGLFGFGSNFDSTFEMK